MEDRIVRSEILGLILFSATPSGSIRQRLSVIRGCASRPTATIFDHSVVSDPWVRFATHRYRLGSLRGQLRGLTAERSQMVAGGGAAKPPETQSKQTIRPLQARRGRRRPDLRNAVGTSYVVYSELKRTYSVVRSLDQNVALPSPPPTFRSISTSASCFIRPLSLAASKSSGVPF